MSNVVDKNGNIVTPPEQDWPKPASTYVHVTKTPEPCDHDWDNDGRNPERRLKCGLSFIAYTHMECI